VTSVLAVLLLAAKAATPSEAPPCTNLATCLRIAQTTDSERCVAVMAYAFGRWPAEREVQLRYAGCLHSLGRYEDAARIARMCVDAIPGDGGCLNQLGASLVALGRGSEARPYLERSIASAVAVGESCFAPASWLIQDALEHEDLNVARRFLDIASARERDRNLQASLAHLESVLALLEGDGERALKRLRVSIELSRGAPAFRSGEPFVLAWQGRFDDAATAAAALDLSELGRVDRESIELLLGVLRGTVGRDRLASWSQDHPYHHRAWFLLALQAHLSGTPQQMCEALSRGHEEAAPTTLHPPWAAGCTLRGCRLAHAATETP